MQIGHAIKLAGMAIGLCAASGAYAATDDVSVERGAHVAIIGGCNDCHTVGYNESNGKVDPAAALKGSPVGYQGPWGTSYPKNLRLTATQHGGEDGFVDYLKTFQTLPPMPWYNVHALEENDMRSLYRYIVSLGEPGDPAPDALPPGATPKTPYIVFAPPVMPQ
jgi:hypothetical protein